MKMKNWNRLALGLALVGSALAGTAAAQTPKPGSLVVEVGKPGPKIGPLFDGLMTEEINHCYDGGLYAELIRNRALKDADGPDFWSPAPGTPAGAVKLSVDTGHPVPDTVLTRCLKIEIDGGAASAGVANAGYWGIPAKPSTTYNLSFYARADGAAAGKPLTAAILGPDGSTTYAKATVDGVSGEWKKYKAKLTTAADVKPSADNRFAITTSAGGGTLYLTQVSLFPPTYNDRPNGLRVDLMERMKALHPTFLRFPGGNYLEGVTIATRFDWKKTLGPIEQRPGHMGTWGYRSSDGLGMMEFLHWCEDLKMQPVLGLYAGYSLNGEVIKVGPKLQPFVEDALDEIEFVIGDPKTTKWGKRRAELGHPEPFKMTYVEIGNEDTFDRSGSYPGRYKQFHDAIRAKHPNLKIIASAQGVTDPRPDVIDDHYYKSAAGMAATSTQYHSYDRSKEKIFVGEWASTEGNPTPTMNAALGDAAFLTGIVKDADVIVMQAYAPLLTNVNPGGSQWPTNLIGFNSLNSFSSPSAYVQGLFAANRGDVVLPVKVTPAEVAGQTETASHGNVGVGTWGTQAEFKDAKVTGPDGKKYDLPSLNNWPQAGSAGTWEPRAGGIAQTGDVEGALRVAGNPAWTDYTYEVKARKTGGAEGFVIPFHHLSGLNTLWWNVGGWMNAYTAFEKVEGGQKRQLGGRSDFTVQPNKWYDLKIVLKGKSIKAFVDGKLVSEATDASDTPDPIYATAARDAASGDVILKVVNFTAGPQPLKIDLKGIATVKPDATATVIQGEPGVMNSIDEPEKVAPQEVKITDAAQSFKHEFPAHSVTVMRLKTK